MSNVSFRIDCDNAELHKQKVTVTSVADATTKSLFGTCDCAIDSDAGTGDFSLVLRILHVGGHVSPGVDYNMYSYLPMFLAKISY